MSQEFQGVYNPADVDIIVNGVTLQGVDEANFIEVERMKPEEYTARVGAKGDFTFIKNLDKSGKIKVTLKQNARRSNEFLASLSESDAVFACQVVRKGPGFREMVQATTCVIGLRPRLGQGAEEGPRQWEILAGVLIETDKAA
jgi:hypothetical protein